MSSIMTGPSLSWHAPPWITGTKALSRSFMYWEGSGWPLLPAW